MGTGKGGVENWVAVVKPGRVIFEVEGVDARDRAGSVPRAHHKLPVKTQLVRGRVRYEQVTHEPRDAA